MHHVETWVTFSLRQAEEHFFVFTEAGEIRNCCYYGPWCTHHARCFICFDRSFSRAEIADAPLSFKTAQGIILVSSCQAVRKEKKGN